MTSYSLEDIALRRNAVTALRFAIDPELGINIVDMGLIYALDTKESSKSIVVTMSLSSRGCPMGAAISGSAENVLKYRFPDYRVRVDIIWEPAWSYEFISARGREALDY